MKIQGEVPLYAGDHTVFGKGLAETLVGQEFPGGRVISATQTAPDQIILAVEMEIPDAVIWGWI